MRKLLLLLCAVMFALPTSMVVAGGGDGGEKNDSPDPLRRTYDSNPTDPAGNPESYPGGPVGKSPLATGYYVTDNDAPQSGAPWAPSYTFVDTTGVEAKSWRRILSGPNQQPISFWEQPGSNGYEYFHNPDLATDSTDDAFAGPIAIGFPFYYYGRKYDSFYVSTNGLIGLANRRYQYDVNGNRIDYDPWSDDIRGKSGNALTDPTPDNYGFQYVARGNTTNPQGGIRSRNNTPFPATSLRSVLAPLWDDNELLQINPSTGLPDDYGRVYWRRDQTGNKLIVYYVNMTMMNRSRVLPIIGTPATPGRRQVGASFQVVIDRSDSTVQYNYVNFRGSLADPTQGIFTFPSASVFAVNATIGVQSHDWEYTNYLANYTPNTGAVYVNGDKGATPHANLAIQFKQWKNVVRVLSVTFQVPNKSNPSIFEPLPKGQEAGNFELLLGNAILGVVRPVGVVENVSSNKQGITGVNYTAQPIAFNVIFRIRDLVNVTAQPVYQKTRATKSLYPIENIPGILNTNKSIPNIDTIVFDPYVTNAQLLKQLGRFKAEVIATDRSPQGLIYGDRWPFDDTTGIRMFGISRQEVPYISTFSDYDDSPEDGLIPPVKRWVSIGAQVVDGEANCYNPPPPRGPAGTRGVNSPVVLLDRNDVSLAPYPGAYVGDTLISFPINLSTVLSRPVIIFSYQRAGRQTYQRGWSDNLRIGPEQSVYNTLKSAFIQRPDQLVVEFAEPSPNGIDNVTNPKLWRESGFNDSKATLNAALTGDQGWGATSPRWGVFGGGGGSDLDTTGKIVVDEFDAGKDFEFYRAYIPIPTRWTKPLNANKTFRFRLRVLAKNDQNPAGPPGDDNDPFFVDNIMLVEPQKPEVEVTAVGADWPYTIAPGSQARAIPLWTKVSNNGSTAATAFGVAMWVVNAAAPPTPGLYNYYRYLTVVSVQAGRDFRQPFPSWNAQECGSDFVPNPSSPAYPNETKTTRYRINAQIFPTGYDSYNANDYTYTDFDLTIGSVFAYDDGSNDVPNFAGLTGKGLNLVAPYPDATGAAPYGPVGGSSAGTFAMQFRILSRDTIRGWRAYFGEANQSPDYIKYSIYQQGPGANVNTPPNQIIARSVRFALRGEGIPSRPSTDPFNFGQFVTYVLDTPLVVEPGLYYATIAQLGQTGLEIGADASRMGQVTTIREDLSPGQGNFSIPAHPEMRANRFWFEATTGSGSWVPMITSTGNPGYPHLNWQGTVAGFPTHQRASWIPMIQPFFGPKATTVCLVTPVELASFEATPLANAVRLDWSTATELNNHGFFVERREKGLESWNELGFVKGNGTSNQAKQYDYTDAKVNVGPTYQYRLRQTDLDGTVSYSGVREARIESASTGLTNSLGQNVPNPMGNLTQIAFNVVESGKVKVEIVDVFGSVVRTFDVDATAGANSITWEGTDENGVMVPSGTYVYKLVGNGFTLSKKLTVTR